MRKLLLSALMGTTLFLGQACAEVIVHTKPPHAVSEHPPAPPGPGYVWIGGYQRWDDGKFSWEPGHWQKPPREHAIWMAARWEKTAAGYVFVEGWWAG